VKRLLLGTVVVGLLVGCGSSGDRAPAPGPPAEDNTVKALVAWTDAVILQYNWLQQCQGHMYPTRNFWAACMKEPRRDYSKVVATTLRSLSRLEHDAPCRKAAVELKRDIAQVTGIEDKVVKSLDRFNNTITAGHAYHGPRLTRTSRSATRTITRRLRAVRALRTGVVSRC
jgi:hypothetical protein